MSPSSLLDKMCALHKKQLAEKNEEIQRLRAELLSTQVALKQALRQRNSDLEHALVRCDERAVAFTSALKDAYAASTSISFDSSSCSDVVSPHSQQSLGKSRNERQRRRHSFSGTNSKAPESSKKDLKPSSEETPAGEMMATTRRRLSNQRRVSFHEPEVDQEDPQLATSSPASASAISSAPSTPETTNGEATGRSFKDSERSEAWSSSPPSSSSPTHHSSHTSYTSGSGDDSDGGLDLSDCLIGGGGASAGGEREEEDVDIETNGESVSAALEAEGDDNNSRSSSSSMEPEGCASVHELSVEVLSNANAAVEHQGGAASAVVVEVVEKEVDDEGEANTSSVVCLGEGVATAPDSEQEEAERSPHRVHHQQSGEGGVVLAASSSPPPAALRRKAATPPTAATTPNTPTSSSVTPCVFFRPGDLVWYFDDRKVAQEAPMWPAKVVAAVATPLDAKKKQQQQQPASSSAAQQDNVEGGDEKGLLPPPVASGREDDDAEEGGGGGGGAAAMMEVEFFPLGQWKPLKVRVSAVLPWDQHSPPPPPPPTTTTLRRGATTTAAKPKSTAGAGAAAGTWSSAYMLKHRQAVEAAQERARMLSAIKTTTSQAQSTTSPPQQQQPRPAKGSSGGTKAGYTFVTAKQAQQVKNQLRQQQQQQQRQPASKTTTSKAVIRAKALGLGRAKRTAELAAAKNANTKEEVQRPFVASHGEGGQEEGSGGGPPNHHLLSPPRRGGVGAFAEPPTSPAAPAPAAAAITSPVSPTKEEEKKSTSPAVALARKLKEHRLSTSPQHASNRSLAPGDEQERLDEGGGGGNEHTKPKVEIIPVVSLRGEPTTVEAAAAAATIAAHEEPTNVQARDLVAITELDLNPAATTSSTETAEKSDETTSSGAPSSSSSRRRSMRLAAVLKPQAQNQDQSNEVALGGGSSKELPASVDANKPSFSFSSPLSSASQPKSMSKAKQQRRLSAQVAATVRDLDDSDGCGFGSDLSDLSEEGAASEANKENN